ncbi:MAG TPA: hypothetical protein VMS93_12780 [Candidatus Saccharimonadales bacterium]|nr:hypothetical protein [Candidatus Saccharimonadales bacterium]
MPDPSGAGGIGGLLVGPTRVVFDGSRRTAQLTLVNTGSKTATYRMSLVRFRMTETGGFQEVAVPDSTEHFADTLVRFSPRRVELVPHVPQTVRLQLRLPADLPPGEYRSHLLFRAVPDAEAAGEPERASAGEIHLRLRPVFGVAVPLIVRHGATSATVSLADLELRPAPGADPPAQLHVVLQRAGNQSVYGDLTAFLARDGEPEEVVGVARGVAVYTPNTRRVLELPIRLPPGRTRQAVLRLTFTDPTGAQDGSLAEATLPLR